MVFYLEARNILPTKSSESFYWFLLNAELVAIWSINYTKSFLKGRFCEKYYFDFVYRYLQLVYSIVRGGLIIKSFGKNLWKKLYSSLFGATVNETK